MELLDKLELYVNEDTFLIESIKTEVDKLNPEEMKRDGRVITLTWSKGDAKTWKKKIETALKSYMDKLKVFVSKKGNIVTAELEMA
jgi:hypothetical protein